MVNVFVAYAIMAIILIAIIAGIVGDYKRYKMRLNALKSLDYSGLDDWFNARNEIAFAELKEEV